MHYKYTDNSSKSVIFISITSNTIAKILQLSSQVVHFGEIAVGIRLIKEINITNLHSEVVNTKLNILPVTCGFSVLNAMRAIKPQQTKSIVVQFQPHEEQPFEEYLTI